MKSFKNLLIIASMLIHFKTYPDNLFANNIPKMLSTVSIINSETGNVEEMIVEFELNGEYYTLTIPVRNVPIIEVSGSDEEIED